VTKVGADAGFTLVELLVSMALLGMAAVLVAQGFAMDRHALGRIEGLTTSGEEVAAAQNLIRDRVERMFPQAKFDSAGAHTDFDGSANEMAFLSPIPVVGKVAQVARVRLSLTSNGALTLAPESAPADAANSDNGILLHKVQGLELAYYGAPQHGAQASWRPDWSSQNSPPELVRVRVSFQDGDPRRWPELIVRPAVTVDTACVLDVATGLCRGRA
jgi:prepilin-type N-terminal cleavage/methylation domain-containing protein